MVKGRRPPARPPASSPEGPPPPDGSVIPGRLRVVLGGSRQLPQLQVCRCGPLLVLLLVVLLVVALCTESVDEL